MAFPRDKQIEFPPMQTHLKWIAPALLLFSVVCIVVVVIILLTHPSGSFIGPW
ncbi:MAG: hypothetical protein KJ051_09390 [Thermoleophilia bacterium]|nr:hypothetical protein [Thermoleophilia bacterium]